MGIIQFVGAGRGDPKEDDFVFGGIKTFQKNKSHQEAFFILGLFSKHWFSKEFSTWSSVRNF